MSLKISNKNRSKPTPPPTEWGPGVKSDQSLSVNSLVESPWMLLITSTIALFLISEILY